jgi:F-type H+-transporting ATPase subunit a
MSFIFIFGDMFSTAAGLAVGTLVSVPLSTAIFGLEIIVSLIQAYVFALLTSIFIGMAIHTHH